MSSRVRILVFGFILVVFFVGALWLGIYWSQREFFHSLIDGLPVIGDVVEISPKEGSVVVENNNPRFRARLVKPKSLEPYLRVAGIWQEAYAKVGKTGVPDKFAPKYIVINFTTEKQGVELFGKDKNDPSRIMTRVGEDGELIWDIYPSEVEFSDERLGVFLDRLVLYALSRAAAKFASDKTGAFSMFLDMYRNKGEPMMAVEITGGR